MSWKVANLCAARRFGSPVRKQIIMFLADKASDDGSGIWCSKGTIQRHTELGETTVKRTINEFLSEGILIETGRRACKNGFTIVYRISLAAVRTLERIAEPEDETGSTEDGVFREPGTGSVADPVPRPQRTPNHPETIHKPPTRAGAREVEETWSAYPEDRRRDQPSCERWISEALDEVDAAVLLAAVRAYAKDSAGFTRSKVSFSDNWFRLGRWRPYVATLRAQDATNAKLAAASLSKAADWIKARHGMCRHLSARQVYDAVTLGLVSAAEAAKAGFGPDGRHV
ncbi:MAG: hypothetical protein QM682_13250 [Paracoccus sp. (in: a-proteobacteria)]|uniref:hypothetical protein n=1 Tax=Paracoccus sp. TaxID=267 RepID=UPI0039E72B3B